jgi:hypothetical protein
VRKHWTKYSSQFQRAFFAIVVVSVLSCSSTTILTTDTNSQRTPYLTILSFKSALDSNAVNKAMLLMAHSSGRNYLAVESYELRDEVAHVQRLLAERKITKCSNDNCGENVCTLIIEFDYSKTFSIHTARINGLWYITNITDFLSQN